MKWEYEKHNLLNMTSLHNLILTQNNPFRLKLNLVAHHIWTSCFNWIVSGPKLLHWILHQPISN